MKSKWILSTLLVVGFLGSFKVQADLIRVTDASTVTNLLSEHSLVLDVREGLLFGAFNVNVLGTSYDVRFVDGTTTEIYGSTVELESSSEAQTLGFIDALSNMIIVDSNIGFFDSDPEKINGCEERFFSCSISMLDRFDPIALTVDGTALINLWDNQQDFLVRFLDDPIDYDTSDIEAGVVMADWSLSSVRTAVLVSEPISFACVLFGITGLFMNRRRVSRF